MLTHFRRQVGKRFVMTSWMFAEDEHATVPTASVHMIVMLRHLGIET